MPHIPLDIGWKHYTTFWFSNALH